MRKNDCVFQSCKIGLFVIIIFLFSGCFGPISPPPENTYILSASPSYVPHKRKRNNTLLVIKTESAAIFDTTKMAYTQKPYQISYFAKNSWADKPQYMLHPLIVTTLQNTHHFRGIATSPFYGRYDYTLSTEILNLTQNFMHLVPRLEFTARVQILEMGTNRIISTKEFSISEPMPYRSPYGGVIAANRAVQVFLEQLAAFVLRST